MLPGHVRSRVEQQAIGSLGGSPETIPLTWHALRVIDLAHEAARQLHNDYVGAEHLLLALLHEGDSSAAHALREAGITWDRVRSETRQLSSKAGESYNRRAGQFLDQARKEAEASRKGAINTEHLLLSLIRLGWRLANPPPPEPQTLAPWERMLSQAVHWGFYAVMIGMPLTGWLMVSASKTQIPTVLFWTVPWPNVPGVDGHDTAEPSMADFDYLIIGAARRGASSRAA